MDYKDIAIKAPPIKKVFSPRKESHLSQPMYFGEDIDVARYDIMKCPWADKLTERQLGFFWRPEEVDLSKDRIDFTKLNDGEKHLFISNLKYQTLLDSVQGRAPNLAFLPLVSLPEIETWIETWSFSETIHSRSYTHIMRNVFVNPSEIFDEIVLSPEILNRAEAVTKEYDKLIDMSERRNPLFGTREHKKQLFLTLSSVNVLEAVRFYVSFACSFAFGERKIMEGNAKIIGLIARDEALHLSGTMLMLKACLEGDEGAEWQSIALECIDDITNMFKSAVDQEKEWANYLFSMGSMIGLNEAMLSQYVEYIADVRIKALGLAPIYDRKNNPLPWMNNWLTKDNVQIAPQETENSSYITGGLDMDISKLLDEIKDFKL